MTSSETTNDHPRTGKCPIDHSKFARSNEANPDAYINGIKKDQQSSSWWNSLWSRNTDVASEPDVAMLHKKPSTVDTHDHPLANPPPGCPMHKASNENSTGFFSNLFGREKQNSEATPAVQPPATCPMSNSNQKPAGVSEVLTGVDSKQQSYVPEGCPVATPKRGWFNWFGNNDDQKQEAYEVDKSNMMYKNIPQTAVDDQVVELETTRTTSSIPKVDGKNWEYPSPQQMYNAMWRKGYRDSGENVPIMVQVHNFLNEGAWSEIKAWEREAGENTEPKLLRFEGNANKRTPRALWYMMLGRINPNRWGSGEGPFDRHDWYVQRKDNSIVRYVIDYYEAPDSADGKPVFSLDVRPAVDSFESVALRWKHWRAMRQMQQQ
ncbi:putative cytochrome c heme lyase [Schizosaccharomyces pombe]